MTKTRARLEQLVEVERLEQPPPGLARSSWDRLSSAMARAAVPLDVSIGPLRVPSNALAAKLLAAKGLVAKAVAAKSLLTMVLAGAATAGIGYGTWVAGSRPAGSPPPKPASAVRAASRARPRPSIVPAAVAPVAVSDEKSSDTALDPDAKRPASPPRHPMKQQRTAPDLPPANAQGTSSFDAELSLLKRAKSELDQARPQLAEAWLSEHAERFPAGVFAAEREALRVLVGCLERADGTTTLAGQRFLQAHPESPVADRIRRACGTQNDLGK